MEILNDLKLDITTLCSGSRMWVQQQANRPDFGQQLLTKLNTYIISICYDHPKIGQETTVYG